MRLHINTDKHGHKNRLNSHERPPQYAPKPRIPRAESAMRAPRASPPTPPRAAHDAARRQRRRRPAAARRRMPRVRPRPRAGHHVSRLRPPPTRRRRRRRPPETAIGARRTNHRSHRQVFVPRRVRTHEQGGRAAGVRDTNGDERAFRADERGGRTTRGGRERGDGTGARGRGAGLGGPARERDARGATGRRRARMEGTRSKARDDGLGTMWDGWTRSAGAKRGD